MVIDKELLSQYNEAKFRVFLAVTKEFSYDVRRQATGSSMDGIPRMQLSGEQILDSMNMEIGPVIQQMPTRHADYLTLRLLKKDFRLILTTKNQFGYYNERDTAEFVPAIMEAVRHAIN